MFRGMGVDKNIKADIRNKLQAPKTALELLSEGKDIPKEFIEMAKKDLDETVKLLGKTTLPPEGWGNDYITKFFEAATKNSYATFIKLPDYFKRLIDIEELFYTARECVQNSEKWFAVLFFLKAHSAFLASIRLSAATQIPEAYMVLRGALENMIYGWYISKNENLIEVWLRRHDSDAHKQQVKNKFKISNMLDLLKKEDVKNRRKC